MGMGLIRRCHIEGMGLIRRYGVWGMGMGLMWA
jgi:hypothetical protein